MSICGKRSTGMLTTLNVPMSATTRHNMMMKNGYFRANFGISLYLRLCACWLAVWVLWRGSLALYFVPGLQNDGRVRIAETLRWRHLRRPSCRSFRLIPARFQTPALEQARE